MYSFIPHTLLSFKYVSGTVRSPSVKKMKNAQFLRSERSKSQSWHLSDVMKVAVGYFGYTREVPDLKQGVGLDGILCWIPQDEEDLAR